MSRLKSKKLLFLGKFILFINWLFVVSLLLSVAAKYVSPEKIYFIAFFGIAFPYLAVVNVLFFTYWILRKRWQFIYSFAALILSWTTIGNFIVINKINTEISDIDYFKVLSYNVHVFDIYNYNKNWVSDKTRRNGIFDFIHEIKPDVFCLQEFVDDRGGNFKILDTLPNFQKAKNFHVEYTKSVKNKIYFGIATFSKFPIVNKGKIYFQEPGNNICIFTDINVNGKIIRFYNVHFQSIKFTKSDYKFADRMREIENISNDKQLDADSRRIFHRMRKAFILRASQANDVAQHIKLSPYPVIVCGDFNDTPSSYCYNTVKDNLVDAFTRSGNGIGTTYVGGSFPSFRIDYILHSPILKSSDFKTHKVYNSDHLPVTCKFVL